MKTFVRWAIVFAVLHTVLALLYARVTPFMTPGVVLHQRIKGQPAPTEDVGAPDELQHVNYVLHIAHGKGLPVLDPKDPDLGRNYESHQPPAYYLMEAGWSRVFGESGMGLRSFNALLGGLTVMGVFFLAWWGLGRGWVAVGAAAFAALLPMNVTLSSAVSNETLLYCLCTWALALAALSVSDGFVLKRSINLGLILGLAFLTKTSALALIPAIGIAFLPRASRPDLKNLAAIAGLAFVLGAFGWTRNMQLYGDPLAMGIFKTAFVNSPQAEMFIAGFGAPGYWIDWVGWWTARSFVGMFGYMDIWLPDNLYRIAIAVLVILATLGLLVAARDRESKPRTFHLMNFVFFAMIALFFIAFNMTYFQGQARYLLPAIGPISIAIALGTAGLADRPDSPERKLEAAGDFVSRRPAVPILALAAALLCLNVYVLQILPSEFAMRVSQTSAP